MLIMNIVNISITMMKNNLTNTEAAKAQRYKEYLLGWAYIPPQDLPLYESAYKKWSHQ